MYFFNTILRKPRERRQLALPLSKIAKFGSDYIVYANRVACAKRVIIATTIEITR